MTWETLLLAGALACFAFALGSTWVPRAPERLGRVLFGTGVALLTFALGLLATYFLVGAVGVEYVFTYTRTDYPWWYRLAGLWAGQKGTLLMWTTFTAVFGLMMLRRAERAIDTGGLPMAAHATVRRIRIALLGVLLAFTMSTLVARTFDATPAYFLQFKPLGNGLQPVLLTPFMVIHPPIQFVAYALAGLLFTGAAAHAATRDPHWSTIIRPWARVAWLLSTIGLGLGGLWAYYVLNFGGFWAWDPVETANLIAWFPITLLLHSLLPTRTGRPRATAPLFAFLALVLALFSTIATRSGLWVSVHAFTDPSRNFASDPLERFLNILETSSLLRYLAFLFAGALLAGLWSTLHARFTTTRSRALLAGVMAAVGAFFLFATVAAYSLVFQAGHAASLGNSAPIGLLILGFAVVSALVLTAPEDPEPPRAPGTLWERWGHPRRLLEAGLLLLGLALLVVFLIDIAGVNGYDRGLFDTRAPLVALPILLTLAATFLRSEWPPKVALLTPVAVGALGGILWWAFPDHGLVLLVVPALLLVLAASLHRFWRLHATPQTETRDALVAALLLAGAFLTFLTWGNPRTHFELGPWTITPSWAWAFPAYAVGAFALLASALHRASPGHGASRLAAILLVPMIGPWGLASACGILALVLARRPRADATPWRSLLRTRRGLLRTSSIYALHAALAIGLMGYVLATYESQETAGIASDTSGSMAFQGTTFHITGSQGVGVDPEQGLPLEIHTHLLVDGGQWSETATLVYWLVNDGTNGHYDARVTVIRRPTQDLYLYPSEVVTPHAVLTDHIHDVRPTDPTVTGIVLTVKSLPGVGLVWSGLWMLGLFMMANLALGGFDVAARTMPHERTPTPRAPEANKIPTPGGPSS